MFPDGEPSVPNGELHVVDDVPAAFADLVARQVGIEIADPDRVRDEPFSLVLSGGSTARECYEQLALEPGSTGAASSASSVTSAACRPTTRTRTSG